MTTPTLYETMYEYAGNGDISHYELTVDYDGDRVKAFKPADDDGFRIDYDTPYTYEGKIYLLVCWGEEEESALIESALDEECWIRYIESNNGQYVSDGQVYETEDAAELVGILAGLTDTQYYCAKCGQVFEYRNIDQHGCEKCNAAINDDQVAGMD